MGYVLEDAFLLATGSLFNAPSFTINVYIPHNFLPFRGAPLHNLAESFPVATIEHFQDHSLHGKGLPTCDVEGAL